MLWAVNPEARATEFGKRRVVKAVEIPARWNIHETDGGTQQQDSRQVTDKVFVDRKIPIGSILWQGKLSDNPDGKDGLFEVKEYAARKDVKGRNTRHWVIVSKFKGKLPEAV